MPKKEFFMLSAINNNNPSFTSVIPIRVFIDNMESFSPKLTRAATRQLTTTLAGPVKGDSKKYDIIRKFAQRDPDYDFLQGVKGYPRAWNQKHVQPSDYFRCIIDESGSYLFTGLQAKKLKELGELLGKAQQVCKAKNISTSFDVHNAKRSYGFNIMNFLRSTKLRITESFDKETKQKIGEQVSLNLHLSSNQKYGQKNFKITLNDISFSKVNT